MPFGDRLVVLAGRDAQDDRVVRGVLRVLVLLVVRVLAVGEAGDRLVELRGLGEEAHRLERRRRDPRALRRLGLVAVVLAGDELRAPPSASSTSPAFCASSSAFTHACAARGSFGNSFAARRYAVAAPRVIAGLRLLLALLEDRLHDERVELLLVRVARERRRALQPARPGLDVLVVLRAIERVEDQLAGARARTGCAGTSRGASPRSSPPSRRRRSRNTSLP